MTDLYNGEKHIREYTLNFLNNIDIKKNTVVFDPACSTGNFLKMENAIPEIKEKSNFITKSNNNDELETY